MSHLKKKIFVKDVKEKAMSNLQNNYLIDVEQYFWDLLNDYGKTNDQALKIIKMKNKNTKKECKMNTKYLRLHILNTTIHKKPNTFVRFYREFIDWLKKI